MEGDIENKILSSDASASFSWWEAWGSGIRLLGGRL